MHRLLPLLQLLVAAYATTTAKSQQLQQLQLFLRSGEVGIRHCTMQGVIRNEDVILHIWIRMTPSFNVVPTEQCIAAAKQANPCPSTALVRGYALLQSAGAESAPTRGLSHAKSIKTFSRILYIRSMISGKNYPLTVTGPGHTADDANSHVLDIHGELQMDPRDDQALDFELRARDLPWYCLLVTDRPDTIQPYLWTRQPKQTEPASTIRRLQTEADAVGSPGQAQTDSAGGQGQATEADSEAALAPAPAHVRASTWSQDTQVWVVLSPFNGSISAAQYARLLDHHVAWHSQLGITRYLLYCHQQMGMLLRQASVKRLVESGQLTLVWYSELPQRMTDGKQAPTQMEQVLSANHALLALWGSDVLVVYLALDEYLVANTPTKTPAEAFARCSPAAAGRLAGIQVAIKDATCQQAGVPACQGTGVVDAGEQLSQALAGLQTAANSGTTKCSTGVMDPNLVLDVQGGSFEAWPTTRSAQADRACLHAVHITDLTQTN